MGERDIILAEAGIYNSVIPAKAGIQKDEVQ